MRWTEDGVPRRTPKTSSTSRHTHRHALTHVKKERKSRLGIARTHKAHTYVRGRLGCDETCYLLRIIGVRRVRSPGAGFRATPLLVALNDAKVAVCGWRKPAGGNTRGGKRVPPFAFFVLLLKTQAVTHTHTHACRMLELHLLPHLRNAFLLPTHFVSPHAHTTRTHTTCVHNSLSPPEPTLPASLPPQLPSQPSLSTKTTALPSCLLTHSPSPSR